MNNIMYGNENIDSNWYISFIWEILGFDDESQNTMEITLSAIVTIPLGVQRIYKWLWQLNEDLKLI